MTDSAAKTPQKRVTVASLKEMLTEQALNAGVMQESMERLQLQLEDRHWERTGNTHSASGLDLKTVQDVAKNLRGWITGGGIMKRLCELRGDTIYGDGVTFSNYTKAKTAFESANNVEKLFSVEAMQEINRAHATDGVIVFLIHKETKEIIRYGIEDMGDPYLDGNDQERSWYVRRTYKRVTPAKPKGETVTVFYATDMCPVKKSGWAKIDVGNDTKIEVDQDYKAVVWSVNRQVGWPFGIPDLLASLQWAEKYTGYLKNQDRFAEALASIAWEYKNTSAAAAKIAGAAIATPQTVAATANHAAGTEMKALPGGSAVSFENGQPLAAQAAAAAGVTVDSLLAESQAAAAQTLDPDVKKMAAARRLSATTILKRIGKLLNAPNLEVIWPDLETESPFREAQMIVAAYGTGVLNPDEIRGPLAHRIRIPLADGSKAPKDAIIPNTKAALKAAADAKPAAGTSTATGNGTNSQGQDVLGVGKTPASNTARDKGEV